MTYYENLGQLLIDFRKWVKISQLDFATEMEVDVRTVSRWEKNETLVKSEKEKRLLEVTFIPYQVIHNLNAEIPIPTYYDFLRRRYSLSNQAIETPDADLWKRFMGSETERLIDISENEEHIEKIIQFHNNLEPHTPKLKADTIRAGAHLLPEINKVLLDSAGFYAGHGVYLPLHPAVYEKIKNQKMDENEISPKDLVNLENQDTPIIYFYSQYADCNDNQFYLMGLVLRYLRSLKNQNYVIAGSVKFEKNIPQLELMGFKLVWKEPIEEGEHISHNLIEGNLHDFLEY